MSLRHSIPVLILAAAALAACNGKEKEQLATFAHADSVHTDSLANVRRDLLEEVMTSTQFVNQINTELAKARTLASKPRPQLETNAEVTEVNEQRKQIVDHINHLVAELNSVESRLTATRKSAKALTEQDSTLLTQVATYEKSIADLQQQAEVQRAQFQTTIDSQTVRIASLSNQVDTLNVVRTALVDTVSHLTTEKNTAYYVIGTKDELIKKGILVAEGQKRFLLLGSRQVAPARDLDPSAFTKIDRLSDRTITLPAGQYEILSRQNPAYATPQVAKDGKIAGGLTVTEPEQFWAPSRFLIIVRS